MTTFIARFKYALSGKVTSTSAFSAISLSEKRRRLGGEESRFIWTIIQSLPSPLLGKARRRVKSSLWGMHLHAWATFVLFHNCRTSSCPARLELHSKLFRTAPPRPITHAKYRRSVCSDEHVVFVQLGSYCVKQVPLSTRSFRPHPTGKQLRCALKLHSESRGIHGKGGLALHDMK